MFIWIRRLFSSLFSEEVEYNMLFFKNELTEEHGRDFF